MKLIKRLVLSLLIGTALLYVAGYYYFSQHFNHATQYAGVNISYLTLDQAEAKVKSNLLNRKINLMEKKNKLVTYQLPALPEDFQLKQQLKGLLVQQSPFKWYQDFLTPKMKAEKSFSIKIDPTEIETKLEKAGISNADRQKSVDAKISYDEESGYQILADETGSELDYSSIAQAVSQAISQDQSQVTVENFYLPAKIQANNQDLIEKLDRITQFIQLDFTYLIADEEVKIPHDTLASWVVYNQSEDKITFDQDKIYDYVIGLDEKYNTFNKTRKFQSTNQGIVDVPPGILGWGISIDEEVEQLVKDLKAAKPVKREPIVYSTGGLANRKDDIGDTHVEIDLTYQTLYLYVNGECIVSTPIVSGQPGSETIAGANCVNEMISDTNLVGFNPLVNVEYRTPTVNYWIRFDDHAQGIHDAPWQGAYGGDVWTYAGSLGCINTPLDAISVVWDHVEYGTPVIVFY